MGYNADQNDATRVLRFPTHIRHANANILQTPPALPSKRSRSKDEVKPSAKLTHHSLLTCSVLLCCNSSSCPLRTICPLIVIHLSTLPP